MSEHLGSTGAQKNAAAVENPPICLVALRIPKATPTWIRLTNNTEDIFDGIDTSSGELIIYTHHPFDVQGLGQNKRADLESITLTVEKPSEEVLEDVLAYDWLLEQPFLFTEMQASPPYDPAAARVYEATIMATKIARGDLIFTIGKAGLAQAPFPFHRYNGINCGADQFGDHRCGYRLIAGATNVIGGGFNFCGHTLTDCDTRGKDELARAVTVLHPRNFDAQPGILKGNTA